LAENTGIWIRGASPAHMHICNGRSNKEDKCIEFRPGGLLFFWPLFMPFCSLHMYHMLLAKQHKNQSKIPTSKCKGYFLTVPKNKVVDKKTVDLIL